MTGHSSPGLVDSQGQISLLEAADIHKRSLRRVTRPVGLPALLCRHGYEQVGHLRTDQRVMILPADWHLIEPSASAQGAQRRDVRLLRRPPGSQCWAVERDGAAYGRFTDLEDAAEHGCRLARRQAACGLVSVVMVEAAPFRDARLHPLPVPDGGRRCFSE